jgi:cytoskeletal protein CcmA (bactofilin family)
MPASHGTFSVIGADVAVTGNVAADGDLHIDGRVNGDVRCATLVLGEGGRIEGNVDAAEARIAGAVDGAIRAGTLSIERSARISGDIAYDALDMAAGARVDGRLTHNAAGGGLKLVASTDGAG